MQQGPQYPFPDYPGYPPPRSGKTVLLVVLVAVGILVLAGLGIGAVFLLTAKDDELVSGEPDRYTALPGCAEVGGHVPDPPPLVRDGPPTPGTASDDELELVRVSCAWAPAAEVTMDLAKSDEPGAGTRYAAAAYDRAVAVGGKPITTGLGRATKAADVELAAPRCGVHFYQGNVDVTVLVTLDVPDQCRRTARSLAEAASASLR
ncbi:hypothetical protein M8542_02290 [Amycolatopsis sp. OK19-0408]|uniref:Uncharacterized protein n=1 Tax=Amycolatopsis iheyensis TaxID=2945988 RepID=A0A9X2N3K5_9PSEU|nr:hypothetical protein [Amycolatopsis iheyensis]MCR6481636.1 hypothetical protein [Amycolatopsis iheyensis]